MDRLYSRQSWIKGAALMALLLFHPTASWGMKKGQGIQEEQQEKLARKEKADRVNQLNAEGWSYYLNQNYKKAVELFTQSAELTPYAYRSGSFWNIGLYNLGVMYYEGLGVEKDSEKALAYFSRCAYADAKNGQGVIYLDKVQRRMKGNYPDREKAKKDWESADNSFWSAIENEKNTEAYFNRGMMCVSTYFQDHADEKGRTHFEEAAKREHVEAQIMLGRLCQEGRGGPKDPTKAIEWLTKAADKGNVKGSAKACHMLSEMYQQGDGVTHDLFEAAQWLQEAYTKSLLLFFRLPLRDPSQYQVDEIWD